MKAIDPRIRAIVDWGNFRVENQAQRIEATRKLLPHAGLVSAKVDRFDAEYRPGYDVAELVRLVEGSGYRGKLLDRDHQSSGRPRARGARRARHHRGEPGEVADDTLELLSKTDSTGTKPAFTFRPTYLNQIAEAGICQPPYLCQSPPEHA